MTERVTQHHETVRRGNSRIAPRATGRFVNRPYRYPRILTGTFLLVTAVLLTVIALAGVPSVAAQGGEEFELPEGVTWDEVNDVAHEMYCDVCEGIPLDECESVACRQWREEIARQLGEGRTENEIFDYFVDRYGGDVAALPRDGSDRLLALIVPVILLLVIGIIGGRQVWQYRQRGQQAGQVARRRREGRLSERPVPDNIDPELLEQLTRELEGLDA